MKKSKKPPKKAQVHQIRIVNKMNSSELYLSEKPGIKFHLMAGISNIKRLVVRKVHC